MVEKKEKRTHRRLPVHVDVICQKVGVFDPRIISGRTLNLSSGGMLLEINASGINDGELLSIDMSVPDQEELNLSGRRISSYARVIRIHTCDVMSARPSPCELTIALEFCESNRPLF